MTQHALIVGLGIAGMASAMSLKKAGWEPVIVERAPHAIWFFAPDCLDTAIGHFIVGDTPDGHCDSVHIE